MKRKLISQLLQNPDPAGELLDLLPADGSADNEAARKVLAAALGAARAQGVTAPEDLYFLVCSSSVAQLVPHLASTSAAKLSKDKIARAQAVLNTLLTSKAGRPKVSTLSRPEQVAAAQKRRREKLGQVERRKQINDWISAEAAAYLNAIEEIHGCHNRAEALELVLQAAIKGKVLKVPAR